MNLLYTKKYRVPSRIHSGPKSSCVNSRVSASIGHYNNLSHVRTTATILLILCSPLWLSAQRKKSLLDKGLDLHFEGKADAAMRILKKSFTRDSEDRALCLYFMGDIESERGNLNDAESHYKTVLTTYAEKNYYFQYRLRINLADIYIKRKEFETALTYLRASEPFKNRHGCGTGKYDQEYELRYKYAVCFSEMNQLDSALKKLSPFMFKDRLLLTGRVENMERNKFITTYINTRFLPRC